MPLAIINSCVGLSNMHVIPRRFSVLLWWWFDVFSVLCCVHNSAESQTFSEDRIRWTGMTWETNQQKYQQTTTNKISNADFKTK